MTSLPNLRQNLPTAVVIGILSMISWACTNEPVVDPVHKQDRRLTKAITAHYFRERPPQAPSGEEQIITYQTIPFYPSYRTQISYTYDQQKRLTQVKATDFDHPGDSLAALGNSIFQYKDNKITYTNLQVSPLIPVTNTLNADGYISEHRSYDSNGYLIEQKEALFVTRQTILDGNIIKRVTEDAIGRSTTTYEYDLLKGSLPDPLVAQHGKPSRNLVLKTTSVGESFTGVAPVMATRTTQIYSYAFNEDGTVGQQTVYIGDNFSADQPIGWYIIEVTTFEYE